MMQTLKKLCCLSAHHPARLIKDRSYSRQYCRLNDLIEPCTLHPGFASKADKSFLHACFLSCSSTVAIEMHASCDRAKHYQTGLVVP